MLIARITLCVALFICLKTTISSNITYTPDWASLDTRPIPTWYDEAKLGIFIHWGVFSVPSYVSEWFWWYWQNKPPDPRVWLYMQTYYPAGYSYPDFAQNFHAEFFDPEHWAKLFAASGAKYVVFTAKHHEGYCNWPSSVSWNWNSVDVGPKRDLVGDLATAIRSKTNLRFGLYHSMFEWFNPLYLADKASGYNQQIFVDQKTMPELFDLVNRYHPSVIWSDGAPAISDYWKAKEFIAWLYNESPVKDEVVVNDRWGSDSDCKHGDFINCQDRYHPDELPKHKWESCMTLDKYSWGFRRESRLSDYLTDKELMEALISVVAYGGNLLLNVGPTSWGTIAPIFEERLLTMGQWLEINGEAIYATKPWKYQVDGKNKKLWYTQKDAFVYALFSEWPTVNSKSILSISKIQSTIGSSKFTLLDGEKGMELDFTMSDGLVRVTLPLSPPMKTSIAWVIKMENIKPV